MILLLDKCLELQQVCLKFGPCITYIKCTYIKNVLLINISADTYIIFVIAALLYK